MLTTVSAWYNDLQISALKPIIMANKVVEVSFGWGSKHLWETAT